MGKLIGALLAVAAFSMPDVGGGQPAPEPIQASVYLEVDARIGAEDLMQIALERFAPVFTRVSDDEAARQRADLVGRLELWRFGNVPGAGWTCIADIAFELYTPDGDLIFREVGRGCGATKLRKGLYEAALDELATKIVDSQPLRAFATSGVPPGPPDSARPLRHDNVFEVASVEISGNVTWDVALDPTQARSATLVISNTDRRSPSVRQINIRGDQIETIDNPPGLPIGRPVSLSSSVDEGVRAHAGDEQYRYADEAWQPNGGFAPCFSSRQGEHEGYCGVVVRGSVVDSPRRWRVEVISGSGISAPAFLPLPMLYRAPKLVVAAAPLESAPFYVVLDRENSIDFLPRAGVLSVQPGWQYVPWEIQLDAAGNAYVLARTSRPQELRFARIPFPELATRIDPSVPLSEAGTEEFSLADALETGRIVNVDTIPIGESCTTCSQALVVDPEAGTALILSREKRDTWNATFIGQDGQPATTALPDTVWPLKVLAGGNGRFYVLGFLPLALANVPGRLGIYSLSSDEPIRHEVTLTISSWALLPPIGFERDPNTGSILTVWHSDRETLHAAWFDPL